MIDQIIETLGDSWGIRGEFLWEMSLREFAAEVRRREGSQRVIREVFKIWTRKGKDMQHWHNGMPCEDWQGSE
jgi:hypothetical protein